MMRMSESWHAFHNRKEARRKGTISDGRGRRELWVQRKELVRQKERTRQRCK